MAIMNYDGIAMDDGFSLQFLRLCVFTATTAQQQWNRCHRDLLSERCYEISNYSSTGLTKYLIFSIVASSYHNVAFQVVI